MRYFYEIILVVLFVAFIALLLWIDANDNTPPAPAPVLCDRCGHVVDTRAEYKAIPWTE